MVIRLNQPHSFCQIGQRENQEDARFPNSDCPQEFAPFFIVCDGVGGSEDGEVASSTVCRTMSQALRHMDWEDDFTTDDFNAALNEAYEALERVAEGRWTDMATTLTFVAFHRGGCTMAHLGDSRIYQIRPERGIMYRSNDHALVNELVHAGLISPDSADTHPERSTITRYMAADDERCMPTLIRTTDVEPGDYFLLCTDGVLAKVSEEMLEEIVCGEGTDAEKCSRIAALSSDSHDNNTAYLISVSEVEGAEPVDDHYYEQQEEDEHVTLRTQRTYATAVDVEPSAQSHGLGGRLSRFFKKVFN